MNSRIVLLSIGVIVIGIFAIPTTLSLFSGQHTFIDANETVSQTCRKCHEDVYEELHSADNTVHWNNPNDINDRFQCRECHNVTNVSYNFLGNNNDAGPNAVKRADAHAATTVSCLACHGQATWTDGTDFSTSSNPMHRLANKYGKGPQVAGAGPNTCGQCHQGNTGDEPVFIFFVDSAITGPDEAHSELYYQSKYPENQTEIALKEANTACIGCHSHTRVNMTWIRLTDYNVTSNATAGEWSVNISNDFPSSTATTYTNKSY